MTKRRQLIVALGAATLSGPLASIAQQKSMPRVGSLSARSRQAAVTILQSLLMRANEVIH